MVVHFTMRIKDGLYENSDEKIGNVEEGDLSIELGNHSQCILNSK